MRRRILLLTLIYQGKSVVDASTHPPLSRSPFPAREGFKETDKSKFEKVLKVFERARENFFLKSSLE